MFCPCLAQTHRENFKEIGSAVCMIRVITELDDRYTLESGNKILQSFHCYVSLSKSNIKIAKT